MGRFPTAPALAPAREAAVIVVQPCRALAEIVDEPHASTAPLAERVCVAITVAEQIGPDRPDMPDLSPGAWTRWVACLAGCDVADIPRAVGEMRLSQRIRARCCTEQDVAC